MCTYLLHITHIHVYMQKQKLRSDTELYSDRTNRNRQVFHRSLENWRDNVSMISLLPLGMCLPPSTYAALFVICSKYATGIYIATCSRVTMLDLIVSEVTFTRCMGPRAIFDEKHGKTRTHATSFNGSRSFVIL